MERNWWIVVSVVFCCVTSLAKALSCSAELKEALVRTHNDKMIINGDSMGVSSFKECQDSCALRPECETFSYCEGSVGSTCNGITPQRCYYARAGETISTYDMVGETFGYFERNCSYVPNDVVQGTCTNADEVTGYEHIADTQTASGELVGDSISLEDCADLCLQESTCQGFYRDSAAESCWKIDPSSSTTAAPGVDLFLKRCLIPPPTLTCPTGLVKAFAVTHKYHHDPVSTAYKKLLDFGSTIEDCYDECLNNPYCAAFTFCNGGPGQSCHESKECNMYIEAASPQYETVFLHLPGIYEAVCVLFPSVATSGSCSPPLSIGFMLHKGKLATTGVLQATGKSTAECMELCLQDGDCIAFDVDLTSGDCSTVASGGSLTTADDANHEVYEQECPRVSPDDCVPGACANGGTCIDGVDSYICRCPPGFEGTDCSVSTSSASGSEITLTAVHSKFGSSDVLLDNNPTSCFSPTGPGVLTIQVNKTGLAPEDTALKVQTENLSSCTEKDLLFYEKTGPDCSYLYPCSLTEDKAATQNYCVFSCKCTGICHVFVGFQVPQVDSNARVCEVEAT